MPFSKILVIVLGAVTERLALGRRPQRTFRGRTTSTTLTGITTLDLPSYAWRGLSATQTVIRNGILGSAKAGSEDAVVIRKPVWVPCLASSGKRICSEAIG